MRVEKGQAVRLTGGRQGQKAVKQFLSDNEC
jgi:hypothetical protein